MLSAHHPALLSLDIFCPGASRLASTLPHEVPSFIEPEYDLEDGSEKNHVGLMPHIYTLQEGVHLYMACPDNLA